MQLQSRLTLFKAKGFSNLHNALAAMLKEKKFSRFIDVLQEEASKKRVSYPPLCPHYISICRCLCDFPSFRMVRRPRRKGPHTGPCVLIGSWLALAGLRDECRRRS